ADQRQSGSPDRAQPPMPEFPECGKNPKEKQNDRRHSRAPVLLEGIGAEQDEAVLLGDERPAGALCLAAGARIGRAPDRVDESPLQQGGQVAKCQPQDRQRREGTPPVGEQVVAKPLHPASPRSATCRLYQFMNAEIDRLMVRNTAMMIATPSIAW